MNGDKLGRAGAACTGEDAETWTILPSWRQAPGDLCAGLAQFHAGPNMSGESLCLQQPVGSGLVIVTRPGCGKSHPGHPEGSRASAFLPFYCLWANFPHPRGDAEASMDGLVILQC